MDELIVSFEELVEASNIHANTGHLAIEILHIFFGSIGRIEMDEFEELTAVDVSVGV